MSGHSNYKQSGMLPGNKPEKRNGLCTQDKNMQKIVIEYLLALPKQRELSLNFQFDNKSEAYNSGLYRIGISNLIR